MHAVECGYGGFLDTPRAPGGPGPRLIAHGFDVPSRHQAQELPPQLTSELLVSTVGPLDKRLFGVQVAGGSGLSAPNRVIQEE